MSLHSLGDVTCPDFPGSCECKGCMDSTGKPVRIGNRVRFRGQLFTVKNFKPGKGRAGTSVLVFEEPITHTDEIPDEVSIDMVDN